MEFGLRAELFTVVAIVTASRAAAHETGQRRACISVPRELPVYNLGVVVVVVDSRTLMTHPEDEWSGAALSPPEWLVAPPL